MFTYKLYVLNKLAMTGVSVSSEEPVKNYC